MSLFAKASLVFVLSFFPALAHARFHRGGPRDEPPPPRVEVVEPRPGYVWMGGHHAYRGHGYVWVPGRHERERRGWEWRDGAWERHEDHYDWHRGGWRRGR
jgi:hypothetical protein